MTLNDSDSPKPLTLSDLGISPKWSLADIEQAIIRMLNDETNLNEYPSWLQLAYFVGQFKGNQERESEIRHLSDYAQTVTDERNELTAELEPQMAWRKWLMTPHNERVGYPFSDLMGGTQ